MAEQHRFLHPLWVLFAVLVLGLPAAALLWPARTPPDNFGAIPDFSLQDERGQPFKKADMLGKIWVTDFIFTRCPDICPTLSARMATLQPRADKQQDIRLLSFSVDPEYDTPAVLTEYAARHSADPDLWRFVTGPQTDVHATIEGFKQVVDLQREEGKDVPNILHSQKFVLIDADGDIRGFYDTDPDALNTLWFDALWLDEHRDR